MQSPDFFYERISIGREFSNLHLKNIVIEVSFLE